MHSMERNLRINIKISEDSAGRERLRQLTNEVYDLLQRPRSYEVKLLSRETDRDAKGTVEFIPGGLTLIVGLTAGLSSIPRILNAWVTRDRYRSVKLENTTTNETIEIKGMQEAEIIDVLETWRKGDSNDR